jgi:lytic murein transglycosylase
VTVVTTRRASLKAAAAAVTTLILPRGASAVELPFDQWTAAFRAKAMAHGITEATYARAMNGIEPDRTGLEAIRDQAEFHQQLWQYLNRAVSDWKVSAGKEKAKQCAPLLSRIEKDFGVEPAFMLGVWGIETAFSDPVVANNHMRPVIPSLATLAWAEPRRRRYWEQELINALTIVQRGWSTPEEMVGSWAGAMGATQWMPEVWLHVGIDYNHDGMISPYGPPDDALGSTARFWPRRGAQLRRMAGTRRHARRWRSLPAAERDGAAVGACAGRPRLPLGSEFLRREELQPVDGLCAGALLSGRPLRRRCTFRADVPGQRAASYPR